jgi:signal transduction histidine kinase
MFDEILIYKQTNTGALEFYQNASSKGFGKLKLRAGERAVFIFSLRLCHIEYNYLSPHLIKPHFLDSYKRLYRSKVEVSKISGYVTSGMLFIIVLFVAANFFLSGKKEFLYYLGYAGCNLLLMFLLALLHYTMGRAASIFYGFFDLILLILSGISYLAFIRYFLETKINYPALDKTFKSTEIFLFFLLVVFTVIHFFSGWYFAEMIVENLMKIILLGIGVLFIVIALKQKKRLLTYLALGSAFAIFFSLVSLFFIWYKVESPSIFTTAIFYYNIGVVFSLGFFLLGLTYKNRRELIDNLKQQAALKINIERQEMESQIQLIKAQQEERNRISADMHDDLGAGMTTIRLYSELAKNRLGSTEVPEIEKISSSANELLTKMNAIIWSMSSSNDSLGNMVAYIRSYSLEYFENTGINCIIDLPEAELPNIVVAGAIRRNVFLVVKESLNNIVKHSGATEVRITLEKVSGGLKLLIHDNGKGIDFDKLRQFGNGLKNMKKRMEDIGINFTIENKNGTLITLYRAIPDF